MPARLTISRASNSKNLMRRGSLHAQRGMSRRSPRLLLDQRASGPLQLGQVVVRRHLLLCGIDDLQLFEVASVEASIAGKQPVGTRERVGADQEVGDDTLASPA